MKLYISGKIGTLDTDYVKKQFDAAVGFARETLPEFDEIFNPPIDNPEVEGKTYKEYMLTDIDWLWDADAILMLPNWKQSKGARIEHAIAKELDKLIFYSR